MGFLADGKSLSEGLDKAGNILCPYPGPPSLPSLSFPAGSGGAPDSDAALALEAKHGKVQGPLRTIPCVVSGVSETREGLPQPLQGVWRRSGRPRPPGSPGPSSPRLGWSRGNTARSARHPGRGH